MEDLLANIVTIQSTPSSQSKPKLKRVAKATVTQVSFDFEDIVPISKLAEAEKRPIEAKKRPAEGESSDAPLLKKMRFEGEEGQDGFHLEEMWDPAVMVGDRPMKASDSAIDNLEAIQHLHSHVVKAKAIKKELVKKTQEVAGFLASLNKAETKIKGMLDKANAAKVAQGKAKDRTKVAKAIVEAVAEAIVKVAKAKANVAEVRVAEVEAKLEAELKTKEAEIKAADEKAYAEG
ncbi:hypothetical protein TEA_028838 [Camellia sinensis var. sinensis]|uniref:Uncharacterized protein n=1 Tax=Camellia sinensis var. sinensis TaxID=542762 RepID=A0A4S4E4Y0_CAMSN|nr:hypothetical protein TEA_028838 [Camellia sinensis var. sinensis]